jgi:hypothetical protein
MVQAPTPEGPAIAAEGGMAEGDMALADGFPDEVDEIRTGSAAVAEMTTDAAVSSTCDYDLCSRRYRSFRPSDCTYQPFSGPRRLCPMQADAAVEADAAPSEDLFVGEAEALVAEEAAPSFLPQETVSENAPLMACNYRACSRSYLSFRPSDCTYQPFDGERRLCVR